MGICYGIACRDCKQKRDVDKCYAMPFCADVNREQALLCCGEVVDHDYRIVLLIGFLYEHRGHNCTVFNDCDDSWEEFEDYEDDDRDFWP